MIDTTCEKTSPTHEWRELFAYALGRRGLVQPAELRLKQ